jgi:biotin transport system ATP-binding protein
MIEVRDLVYRYEDRGRTARTRSTDREGDSDGDGNEDERTERSERSDAVLRGVGLTIRDGSFVLVVGPNGSGKTTLVRHFNGLLEPDAGEVRVNGRRVDEDLVAARSAVGMTFQNPRDAFVASSVGADVAFGPENLGLDRREIDRRVERALSAVEMSDRRDERLTRLSGGEQTRVGIAGALAMEPDHLVLDEPFAGLDWPARERLLDRLAGLHRKGTGVIIVTHDLTDLAERAERIVVLSEGQVAADGPPADVRGRLAALGVREPSPAES